MYVANKALIWFSKLGKKDKQLMCLLRKQIAKLKPKKTNIQTFKISRFWAIDSHIKNRFKSHERSREF